MYRTMVHALDKRMNRSVEQAFPLESARDAYVCEAILECVRNGDYADIDDVKKNIKSEKPREFTLPPSQGNRTEMMRKGGRCEMQRPPFSCGIDNLSAEYYS